jgi:hypothetical protein
MTFKFSMKKRTHGIIVFTLALTLTVLAAACSKNSNTGDSSNSTGSSNSATGTSSTAKPAGASPTETMKAYYDAAKRKDIAAVKKFLSRGTMQIMEDLAKGQGKTVDQMFSENAGRDAQMPTPEFTNEKVNGDTATLDINAPGKPVVTMQMVKEDGEWKLAIDKMMKGPAKP